MNLTKNKPKLSGPEQKFRDHVDNMVDTMSRYSVNKLKKKVDHQRQIDDYKRAMAQKQILTEQSKHEFSKVQSINDNSTVALPEPLMSEMMHTQNNPTSMSGHDYSYRGDDIEAEVVMASEATEYKKLEPHLVIEVDQPILTWSKVKGLYVVPVTLQANNDGQIILTCKSISKALKAAGKALNTLHDVGECHGQVNLEHLVTDAQGRINLLAPSVNLMEDEHLSQEWDKLV